MAEGSTDRAQPGSDGASLNPGEQTVQPAPHGASRRQGEETVHATCVVIGEAGVLILGPSGAGKSTFARQLMDTARLEGRFGRLVSDDRTRLSPRSDRLVARSVASIAGRLEARGIGLLNVPYEGSAVVRLVVELSTYEPNRLPDPELGATRLCGVKVSRLCGQSGASLAHLVLARLSPARGAEDDKVVTG